MTLQPGDEKKQFSFPKPDSLLSEPFSGRKLRRYLALFGPAAVVASISVGAGETVLAVRTGAWAGYGLLWLIMLATLTKNLFLQYTLGRYTVITGEFPGHAWARMPGPRGWFVWLILIIEVTMAPFFVSAIAGACGGLMKTIFGFGDLRVWGILFALAAVLLGFSVSFSMMEKQQVIICAVLVLGTLIGAVIASPSLLETIKGLFSFGNIPPYPDWVQADPNFLKRSRLLEFATVFGYIGGSMTVYVVYPHWASLHGWGMNASPQIEEIRDFARYRGPIYLSPDPEEAQKAEWHLTSIRWDVGMGAFVLLFVSCAFVVAGAAVLHPRHLLPGGFALLSHQKAIWEQLSPLMVPVYYISVLTALWGTLYSLPEMYARLCHEFLGALFEPVRRMNYRRFSLYAGIYIGVISIFVIWSKMQPVTMMDIAAMVSTNIGILLAGIGAIWLNSLLPKGYRMGKSTWVGMVITIAMLVLVSVLSVTQMWAKYFGH